MNRPHVERLRVQHYGCVQDCTLALTPLHALVGPNDSGKSTVLTALRTLGQWAMRLHGPDEIAARDRLTERFSRAGAGASLAMETSGSAWTVRAGKGGPEEQLPGDHFWTALARGTPVISRVVGENVGRPERDVQEPATSQHLGAREGAGHPAPGWHPTSSNASPNSACSSAGP